MVKKIKKSDLPQAKTCEAVEEMTKLSMALFDLVSAKMTKAIVEALREEKLAKSERGWTGKVPTININVEDKLSSVMSKHLKVLEYLMLGKAAGKEAKEAAEGLELKGKIIPGMVFGSFLQAVDSQREYYTALNDKEAPLLNMKEMQDAFQIIQNKTSRMLAESLEKYKNSLIEAVEMAIQERNHDIISSVHEAAHKELEGEVQAIHRTIKEEEAKVDEEELVVSVDKVVESYRRAWETNSETLLSLASSSGTHQAITEIFGPEDSKMRACLLNFRDAKCCDTCEEMARLPDGNLRIYELKDFKPAGYNFKRKKADWALSIGKQHYNCRCNIIYLPPKAKVDKDGSIYF